MNKRFDVPGQAATRERIDVLLARLVPLGLSDWEHARQLGEIATAALDELAETEQSRQAMMAMLDDEKLENEQLWTKIEALKAELAKYQQSRIVSAIDTTGRGPLGEECERRKHDDLRNL